MAADSFAHLQVCFSYTNSPFPTGVRATLKASKLQARCVGGACERPQSVLLGSCVGAVWELCGNRVEGDLGAGQDGRQGCVREAWKRRGRGFSAEHQRRWCGVGAAQLGRQCCAPAAWERH